VVGRYRCEGEIGLLDRSSAARRVHNRTPELRVQAIAALRRLRFTGAQIAELLGMPETTVSGILTRIGLGKLGRLGLEPAVRYERQRAGELLHIDVKKLGHTVVPGHRVTGNRRQRGRRTTYTPDGRQIGDAGWGSVHVCVDDATRLAYAGRSPPSRASSGLWSISRRRLASLSTWRTPAKTLFIESFDSGRRRR
jgi:hypothetical protein